MSFYNNYVEQCNKKGKSPSAAAEEMGFKRSVITRWKNGAIPRQATLQKIAKYFSCTLTDLTMEFEQKEKPAQESGPNKDALYKVLPELDRGELIDLISKASELLREK